MRGCLLIQLTNSALVSFPFYGQTDSQSVRQTDNQLDRQSVRATVSQSVRQTDSQTESQSHRQSVRQANNQSDRQTDSQMMIKTIQLS